MQWSFSNNGSATSSKMFSFQHEKPKTGFDSLVSSGLVKITTGQVSDSDRVARPLVEQRNTVIRKQAGDSTTTYPGNRVLDIGTTDISDCKKMPQAPGQLTIFYNGSVCVYDNILLEKAQAIMLLAGDGNPTTPIGVSHEDDAIALKPAEILVSPSNKAEIKVVKNPIRSLPENLRSAGTVPQFRGKSLARFLEKRKERVTSASPYADKDHLSSCTSLSTNYFGSRTVPTVN